MSYMFLFLKSLAILVTGGALWESVGASTGLSHGVTLATFLVISWLWRRHARGS